MPVVSSCSKKSKPSCPKSLSYKQNLLRDLSDLKGFQETIGTTIIPTSVLAYPKAGETIKGETIDKKILML